MLPPCGCCRRAWRSAVLQGSADSISTRILLPPRLGTRMHSWHPMGRPEYRPLAYHEVQRSPPRWPLRKAPPTASNSSARALSATGPAPASAEG
ncbi:hypothetical protein EMIHUDRAFT_439433 [Emiliania huxleyi CCMP1516]|uniref:Uncharacterized protein n=2 Tax=Emiliania huxleyi TaxID=2903 RepID=A0A0D3KZ11_EMIH1|nr:hypothetical protein EMIHUDRAFT_439433 [Emiliania huxleyi CCMP1516]EOD40996.1 hypothetical protein EMIHUDRAFT_439433 [Emiliania huxleyi CCMP1516]|eukprot:XP_005793425.1 hypothetical protein EMIHUDRAFT_439433 [Emiliania huxleyi CCMP1516]